MVPRSVCANAPNGTARTTTARHSTVKRFKVMFSSREKPRLYFAVMFAQRLDDVNESRCVFLPFSWIALRLYSYSVSERSGSAGLDFGTTNSAIARVIDARPVLAQYAAGTGSTNTFPSILYFERRKEGTVTRLTSAAGPAALQRYLEAEDKGRLIQSLKAYLADWRFDGTSVFSKRHTLEDMIALIVRHLLNDAEADDGRSTMDDGRWTTTRVVVGRPVHFSNADRRGRR